MPGFHDVSQADYFAFVQQNPLAWIVPHSAPEHAMLMPILFEDACCESLFSHLPMRAPIVTALRENTDVTCLFLGPNRYIPPEWLSSDSWIPTWNFTSMKVSGTVDLAPDRTRETVERLTKHMQKDSHSDWSIDKVAHRMDDLLPKIIGLAISADKIEPRFKLGQDETHENLAKIKTGLQGHSLLDWMR